MKFNLMENKMDIIDKYLYEDISDVRLIKDFEGQVDGIISWLEDVKKSLKKNDIKKAQMRYKNILLRLKNLEKYLGIVK